MCNKFIRNCLLLACASFTFSTAYAMDVLDPKENQWRIKEVPRGRFTDKNITVKLLKGKTFIKKISASELKDNSITIRISPPSKAIGPLDDNPFRDTILSLNHGLNSKGIFYVQDHHLAHNYTINCTNKIDLSKFLSVFYNQDLIPDFVIERIINHMEISDFRMDTDRMIAFDQLAIIQDPVRPKENQWCIKEVPRGRFTDKNITVKLLKGKTFIKKISASELKDNSITIRISPSSKAIGPLDDNPFRDTILSLNHDLNSKGIFYVQDHHFAHNYTINCTNKIDPSKFLSVFYNKDLIPDLVIDRIINHMEIADFRMDTDRMIARINEHKTEDSTAADFAQK